MARPGKLNPDITKLIGDNILWDLHTLWLEALAQPTRLSISGCSGVKIQHLESIISSINILTNVMLMELGNYSNAFKKLLKLETFGYVYGSWNGGFWMNLEEGYIGKIIQFLKIKTKMLR